MVDRNIPFLCYGIEFSYDDVKHLKETAEFKELAIDIGNDDMSGLWDEMGHIYTTTWADVPEEQRKYILGEALPNDLTLYKLLANIDEDEVKTEIQYYCNKYNLQYSEPKILGRPSIS